MSANEIESEIEGFIRTRFHVPAGDAGFTRRTHLFEEGYVDSIGFVELIGFIESNFDVALPDESFFDPAFNSVDGIARVVERVLDQGRALGAAPDARASARPV